MTTEQISIVNGPGEWALIQALHTRGATANFQFQYKAGGSRISVTVELSGFDRDCGAWDNTRLRGSSTDPALTEGACSLVCFEMDYDQTRRNGTLTITSTQ